MSAILRSSKDVLCQSCRLLVMMSIRQNSNKAAICRTNRSKYTRMYPTMLVQPDGSTITIRYQEPRKIIKHYNRYEAPIKKHTPGICFVNDRTAEVILPLDLSTLSEADRQKRLLRRKPKKKIIVEDDIEDTFDVNKYSHLWKK